MDRWWVKLVVMVIGAVIILSLLWGIFSVRRENRVLRESVKQQERMIEEREKQVRELQDQLEELRKQQVLRERKIVVLRRQREEIKKPVGEEEIVERFRKLGYEVKVREKEIGR